MNVDEMVAQELRVFGLSIGSKPHDLVLARIDLEPEIVGESRVQEAERMREVNLAMDVERLALAQSDRSGGPFADAVHGENRGTLEWRRIERTCRVRLVVLCEDQLVL